MGGIVPQFMIAYFLNCEEFTHFCICKIKMILALFPSLRVISLFTGRNASRGKVDYSWISADPTKAPTLGGVVLVVVVVVPSLRVIKQN